MKRICLSAVIALSCASFLPSCGGGGDGAGDQFVSVNNLRAGSAGFTIEGSNRVIIIPSGGDVQGTTPGKNPYPEIEEPSYTTAPEVFTDIEEKGEASCYVQGRWLAPDGSKIADANISYTTTPDKRVGYMHCTLQPQSTGVGVTGNPMNYLTNWLGFLSPDDIRFTGWGSDTAGAEVLEVARVVLTSLEAAVYKIWFDFETNTAYLEVEFQAGTKIGEDWFYSFQASVQRSGLRFMRYNQT